MDGWVFRDGCTLVWSSHFSLGLLSFFYFKAAQGCRILVPHQGSNPSRGSGVLTTGPPGNSLDLLYFIPL